MNRNLTAKDLKEMYEYLKNYKVPKQICQYCFKKHIVFEMIEHKDDCVYGLLIKELKSYV